MVYSHDSSSASGSTPGSSSVPAPAPAPGLGSMSTLASASGANFGPSAATPQAPSIPSQPVKRRRYARRSCLTCRSKKTRCELPDEGVASSHDPLPVFKACHRCRALDIPCVVGDGYRKRKPRIHPSSPTAPSRNLLPPVHPRGLDTAYPPRGLDQAYSDSTPSHSSHRSARPYTDGSPYPSHDWHSPSTSSVSANRLSPRRADLYERSRYPPDAGPDVPASRHARSSATTGAATSAWPTSPGLPAPYPATTPADGHYRAALFINAESSKKENVMGHQIPILSTRFLHSPLVTLNRFITKLPPFSRLLRLEVDPSFDGQLSSLLTDQNIHELQQYLPRLRMWHPHIPDLETLRAASRERSSQCTSLLLATVCFAASKIAGDRHLATQFAATVDRIGLQVLISAPKELHVAQAFELLLSHGPSLIGASVESSGAASNQAPAFGESLHSSAISIAQAIGLDLVMSQASQQGLVDLATNSSEQIETLRAHLQRFSLWCSLSIWRSKFAFLNPVLRPYNFSRLRHDAHLAISIVDKLRQCDHNNGIDTSKDEILFQAGVLALCYRAIQVADFHSRLSQLETLWNSRPLFSEIEIRREISSRTDQSHKFLQVLQRTKRQKLWVMANLPELKFLDCWTDLEFESDATHLFHLHMRMVLPINKATGTLLDLSQTLGCDASLFRFMFDISERSFLNDERALAAFAGTLRFEGESLEQSGLPLLLTCGYILHITICLMESINFQQYSGPGGPLESAVRGELFAIVFPKLAERLYAPSRHDAESLEKLVSSMLVQMTRRLEDFEVSRVAQSTGQPSFTCKSQAVPNAAPSNHRRRRSSDSNGYPSSQMSNSTPQHHGAVSSNSGAVTRTDPHVDTPSTSWQDATSSAGQSHQSKHALGSLIHPQLGQASSNKAGGSMASDDAANNTPARPFTAANDVNTLLSASDGWASDNMTRIMDQILSWDYVADMSFPNGN